MYSFASSSNWAFSLVNITNAIYALILVLALHLFHKHLQKPPGELLWPPSTMRKKLGQTSRYYAVVPGKFAKFLQATILLSLEAAVGLLVVPVLGRKRSESG